MAQAELNLLARSMADPWWAIEHTVEAARVRQAVAAENTDLDDDEDPVSQFVERLDDGPRWLGRRSARVVGMARRRTCHDGGPGGSTPVMPWHQERIDAAGRRARVRSEPTPRPLRDRHRRASPDADSLLLSPT